MLFLILLVDFKPTTGLKGRNFFFLCVCAFVHQDPHEMKVLLFSFSLSS